MNKKLSVVLLGAALSGTTMTHAGLLSFLLGPSLPVHMRTSSPANLTDSQRHICDGIVTAAAIPGILALTYKANKKLLSKNPTYGDFKMLLGVARLYVTGAVVWWAVKASLNDFIEASK